MNSNTCIIIIRDKARFWAAVYQNQKKTNESVIVWWCGKDGKIAAKINWPGTIQGVYNLMGNPVEIADPMIVTDDPYYVRVNSSSKSVIAAIRDSEIQVVNQAIEIDQIQPK